MDTDSPHGGMISKLYLSGCQQFYVKLSASFSMKNVIQKLAFMACIILLYQTTTAQVPTIGSFGPSNAQERASVVLTGANFSTVLANNIVYFGGVRATITSASATELVVTVPVGATYAPISVTNGALTAAAKAPFVVLFPSSQFIDPSSFASRVDLSAGHIPYAVALGDLDGDGKLDVVAAIAGTDRLSVYRNISTAGSLSTSSFTAPVDFATGSDPLIPVIADLDGDGKLDIVVANALSGTVSVFRNIGSSGSITTGSFAAKVEFTTGTYPFGVAVWDVEGDGKADEIGRANV